MNKNLILSDRGLQSCEKTHNKCFTLGAGEIEMTNLVAF